MKRGTHMLAALCAVLLLTGVAAGCSLTETKGGEGDKGVDVNMGGQVMTTDYLSFQAVSYAGQQLTVRNTADSHDLALGIGTPIATGDGTTVATVQAAVTIAPGQTGVLTLTAPLASGQTYYLGAMASGSKPSIRQMFVCP